MNKNTLSNPVRSIAFFLTAIILACTFGFTVDGWQAENDNQKEDESVKLPEQSLDDTEGADGEENPEQQPTPDEPDIHIPEYTNRITGLEINEELANATSLAFVMNSDLPSYAISYADMLCEIPVENGGTRLIAIISNTEKLWKIGSITNTRGYISNIAKYFSSAIVSCGSDDSMQYTKCDTSGMELDLSESSGFHYTEYTNNVYTNPDLLSSGLENAGIVNDASKYSPLPYIHTDFGKEDVFFAGSIASALRIKGSANSTTEFRYNDEDNTYAVYKNGIKIKDSLNEISPTFTNCFILFADSTTYDSATCNQMVMDTIGSGSGYYLTGGSYAEIKWSATAGGIMTFYSNGGEKLTVNRGTSFISFVKSSAAGKITIE